MKKTLAIASLALLAASLTSCGSGGDSGGSSNSGSSSAAGYCDLLKSAKADFGGADFTGMTQPQFDDITSRISDIEAVAPDAVKDDWATLGDGLGQFETILNDAGISITDLQKISQTNQLPDGVDLQKIQELGTKMQQFTKNSNLDAASEAITQSAKSECGIEMGNSTATPSATPSS